MRDRLIDQRQNSGREPAGEDGRSDAERFAQARAHWVQVVERCPIAVLLIEVSSLRVLASSAPARSLLGEPRSLLDVIARPEESAKRLRLLQEGLIDAYRAHGTLIGRGHSEVLAEWSIERTTSDGGANLAVIVLLAEDPALAADHAQALSGLCARADATDVELRGPMAMGTVDREWRITRLSNDAVTLLGMHPAELVGTGFTALVHPHDLAHLLIGTGRAFEERSSVTLGVRLRCKGGDYLACALVVAPLEGPETQEFAFIARPVHQSVNNGDAETSPDRTALLEQRLWRIALEVQAAGIVHGLRRLPDLHQLPEMGGLSARQLEVLTRLVEGQRVPTIAASMFVSQKTVRNHLSAIYRRLGVHSQSELLNRLQGLGATAG